MIISLTSLAIITLLLIFLSYTDLKDRIISNRVVLFLILPVVLLSWSLYQAVFIIPALLTLGIGFVLFLLRVIGAGDIKLMSVLMLTIPSQQAFGFLLFTALLGGVLAIIGLLFWSKSVRRRGLPYGIAISLGFLVNFILFNHTAFL